MKTTQANIYFAALTSLTLALAGCGAGGGAASIPATSSAPSAVTGSSASSSGSTGVYTNNGASYALTPAPAAAGTAKLLTLPNSGGAVGVLTVTNVSSTPITTSLTTTINGTSVDPANNIGMAFSYLNSKISIFGLPSHPTSPNAEISTYDTLTTNTLGYSGGSAMIPGAVMNTANQTLILATGDGFEVVDYTNPAALTKLREIPSIQANPASGVEVTENFAFDPNLPVSGTNHAMIITGGHIPVMTLVDANSGTIYKPDTATAALFTVSIGNYIDAAAVDTTYHVAVLADEGTGTTFVDLTKLTLDAVAGTYTLPTTAVNRITTYYKYDNLAIESTKHLVMMGQGYGGTSMVVGLLKDPAAGLGLGFSKEVIVNMPAGTDDTNAAVTWSGSGDPHGAGAYITDPTHPTYTTPTALGLWVNWTGDHIAIIDLQGVLDGTLAAQVIGAPAYDPTATTPKDIAYFKIP